MTWKVLSNTKLVDRNGDVENVTIQYDGNFYRIQNDFGNMFFEFDASSGYEFATTLNEIIKADIEEEVVNYLNNNSNTFSNSNTDTSDPQTKLFGKDNKSTKKGLTITKNGSD